MMEAGLPAFVTKTTLPGEKQQALREFVQRGEYNTQAGRQSILLHGKNSARIAAVVGKELLISESNLRMTFLSLAGLISEADPERYYDTDTRQLPQQGSGFVIVPDFDNADAIPTRAAFFLALEWLSRHIANGGGVVLATETDKLDPTYHGRAFGNALATIRFFKV